MRGEDDEHVNLKKCEACDNLVTVACGRIVMSHLTEKKIFSPYESIKADIISHAEILNEFYVICSLLAQKATPLLHLDPPLPFKKYRMRALKNS